MSSKDQNGEDGNRDGRDGTKVTKKRDRPEDDAKPSIKPKDAKVSDGAGNTEGRRRDDKRKEELRKKEEERKRKEEERRLKERQLNAKKLVDDAKLRAEAVQKAKELSLAKQKAMDQLNKQTEPPAVLMPPPARLVKPVPAPISVPVVSNANGSIAQPAGTDAERNPDIAQASSQKPNQKPQTPSIVDETPRVFEQKEVSVGTPRGPESQKQEYEFPARLDQFIRDTTTQPISIRTPLSYKVENSLRNKLKRGGVLQSDIPTTEQLMGITTLPIDGCPTGRVERLEQLSQDIGNWMGDWQERANDVLERIEADVEGFEFSDADKRAVENELACINDNLLLLPLNYSNTKARIGGTLNAEVTKFIREPTVRNREDLVRWENQCRDETLAFGRIVIELQTGSQIGNIVQNALTRVRVAQEVNKREGCERRIDVLESEVTSLKQGKEEMKELLDQLKVSVDDIESKKSPRSPSPTTNKQLDEFIKWVKQTNPFPYDPEKDVVIGAGPMDLLSYYNILKPFLFRLSILNHKGERCEGEYKVASIGQAVGLVFCAYANNLAWFQIVKDAKPSVVNIILNSMWGASIMDEEHKAGWEANLHLRAFTEALEQQIDKFPELQWYLALLFQKKLHYVLLDQLIGTNTDPSRHETYVSSQYFGENQAGKFLMRLSKRFAKRFRDDSLVEWAKEHIVIAHRYIKEIWVAPQTADLSKLFEQLSGKISSNYCIHDTMPEGQIRQLHNDTSNAAMDTNENTSERAVIGTEGNDVMVVDDTAPLIDLGTPVEPTPPRLLGQQSGLTNEFVADALARQFNQQKTDGQPSTSSAFSPVWPALIPQPQRQVEPKDASRAGGVGSGAWGNGPPKPKPIPQAAALPESVASPDTEKPTTPHSGGLMGLLTKKFKLDKKDWIKEQRPGSGSKQKEVKEKPKGVQPKGKDSKEDEQPVRPCRAELKSLTKILQENRKPATSSGGHNSTFTPVILLPHIPIYIPNERRGEPPIERHPWRQGLSKDQDPVKADDMEGFPSVLGCVDPLAMEHVLRFYHLYVLCTLDVQVLYVVP